MQEKVNPTQCEALTMVCAQEWVMMWLLEECKDTELNVFKPVMAANSYNQRAY
jgi:fumarate hydratase class II